MKDIRQNLTIVYLLRQWLFISTSSCPLIFYSTDDMPLMGVAYCFSHPSFQRRVSPYLMALVMSLLSRNATLSHLSLTPSRLTSLTCQSDALRRVALRCAEEGRFLLWIGLTRSVVFSRFHRFIIIFALIKDHLSVTSVLDFGRVNCRPNLNRELQFLASSANPPTPKG